MVFESIILGLVQGISEFLPISSSGHLVLARFFFNWTDPGLAFDVALHMGTLAAVFLFFWRDWIGVIRNLAGKPDPKNPITLSMLIVGTIPAGVAGLLLEDYAENMFRHPALVAATLAIFGLLLGYWDYRGKKDRNLNRFTLKDAFIVGLAQALAIIPGVSRSGITITAALALGVTRPAAARFSFLLSAPVIAGAGLLKSKHIVSALGAGGSEAAAIAAGFLSSLLSGLLAIWLLNYIIRGQTFKSFVVYRVALSVVIVVVTVIR